MDYDLDLRYQWILADGKAWAETRPPSADGANSPVQLRVHWQYVRHDRDAMVYRVRVVRYDYPTSMRLMAAPTDLVQKEMHLPAFTATGKGPLFSSGEEYDVPPVDLLPHLLKHILPFAEEQLDSPLQRAARLIEKHRQENVGRRHTTKSADW